MIRAASKNRKILEALAEGPLTATELADIVDDIPASIARTMARLRDRGLTINSAERQGRGSRASYQITAAGRACLELTT